jgi:hypothetical protein
MRRIYKTTDVIKLKVGGLVVGIRPLTYSQKADIQAKLLNQKDMRAMMDGAVEALRCSLVSIDGVQNFDGSPFVYSPETDFDNVLNLIEANDLTKLSLNLLNGIPDQFVDPRTGEPIEGVSFVEESPEKKS